MKKPHRKSTWEDVVIVVDGGNVVGVYARPGTATTWTLIDHDNIASRRKSELYAASIDAAVKAGELIPID